MPQTPETTSRTAPLRAIRTPLRELTFWRLLRGGRTGDLGRLPRYAGIVALGLTAIWAPITGYLAKAPLSYRSEMSLILPGSGASASVNLAEIGQASSYANSAFSSNSVSPTETYKRLLNADRILAAAAAQVGVSTRDFGKPRIELVDQTGLIHVSHTGASAEDAQARLDALLLAFFGEIEALRADEISARELGAGKAIEEYRTSVLTTRAEISRLQEETGLVSPDQYTALVTETDALERRVQDMRTRMTERTGAVAALETALGLSPRLASAALRLHADSEFAALAEAMSAHSATLSDARSKYGARHPKVRTALAGHEAARGEARRRAAFLTGMADADIDRLDLSQVGNRSDLLSELVTLDAERAGFALELETLETRLSEAQAKRDGLLTSASRLEDLQRDFSVAEAVFASAMARSQSSKADLFASYPLVQVLQDPSFPDDPGVPRKKLALAAGGGASVFFLLGLLLSWMRRPLVDRLLTTPEERGTALPAAA